MSHALWLLYLPFFPETPEDFSQFLDFPIDNENLYSSPEELNGHVCLYHYPFVYGYQCGFCVNVTAVFPTWSQMGAHFHKAHNGLVLSGQATYALSLAESLATPLGRATHLQCAKPIFNEKIYSS